MHAHVSTHRETHNYDRGTWGRVSGEQRSQCDPQGIAVLGLFPLRATSPLHLLVPFKGKALRSTGQPYDLK